ncbi:MAG: rRNA ((1498)-N(3))-methyltransferase [Noviherbaspirillum sp.]|nr:rRNA ((1498)-N(3))-methyltransferase [Noviherbaspirillum sp.]
MRGRHTGYAMPRFYYPQPLNIGATIDLPELVAHHVRVLRLIPGDQITLFNGAGGEYVATLASVEKKRAEAEIKTFSPREAELPYALTLAQALPEASKMDWIIEKAIELGVTAIEPLAAQRCVVRLSSERAEKKLAHWQAIIVAAAEQCGRNRLPHLAEPSGFSDWLSRDNLHARVLLTPRADQSLSDWARRHPPQSVALMIGPEGGFTAQEEDLARAQGVLMLSMGPRVLRTETAGLAALAALNAVWGEL